MIQDILERLTELDPSHFKKSHNGVIYWEEPKTDYVILVGEDGKVRAFNLGGVAMHCFLILKERYRGNRDGTTPMAEIVTMSTLFQTSASGLTPEKILETYANWLGAKK